MKIRFLILFIYNLCFISCKNQVPDVPEWDIFESQIINTNQYEDPYRDVDLIVMYTRPDRTVLSTYGFYDGGVTWRFRCMPDMEGKWRYKIHFSDDSKTGEGSFLCIESDLPGIATVYENNPVWLGFRNRTPVQLRSFHVGDRFFASNFEDERRTEFLNWAQNRGYNMLSIASHFLNRNSQGRGAGWDTPDLWPLNAFEYRKMESILDDLKARKILVFPFAGFFGRAALWPVGPEEQELYIKYTLARLAPFWNLIFNVAGPEPLLNPGDYQGGKMTSRDINRIAGLIKKYDPYDHILSIHNRTRDPETDEWELDPFIFQSWEDYIILQGAKGDSLNEIYTFIQEAKKIVKPVYAQEVLWYGNQYHADLTEEQLRKKAIVLIMAGAFINFGDMNGNSSSGFTSHMMIDSASIRHHRIMKQVWDFFDRIPFYELFPRPDLVNGGYCLASEGAYYLVYLDGGGEVKLNWRGVIQKASWIHAGTFDKSEISADPQDMHTFKAPGDGDWFLWIEMEAD